MRDQQAAPEQANGKRMGPMVSVAGITLVALAGVGVLAVQANGSAPKVVNGSAQNHPQATDATPSPGATAPAAPVDPKALPANSGSGLRIVYSLAGNRIWLVASDNTVQRTAPVVPGTVPATPGDFKVLTRTLGTRGQDGTSVQYIVIFSHAADGTSLGFDAVYGLDHDAMPPVSKGKTGGVRMTQDDAAAVWAFTSSGTPVKVIP